MSFWCAEPTEEGCAWFYPTSHDVALCGTSSRPEGPGLGAQRSESKAGGPLKCNVRTMDGGSHAVPSPLPQGLALSLKVLPQMPQVESGRLRLLALCVL